MSVRFLSICPVEGANILLQSFCEEFEKCKKALSRIRNPASDRRHLDQGNQLIFTLLVLICRGKINHNFLVLVFFFLFKHSGPQIILLSADLDLNTEFGSANSMEYPLPEDGPDNCEVENDEEDVDEEEDAYESHNVVTN